MSRGPVRGNTAVFKCIFCFCFHGLTALVGVDFIEVSRSHSDTPQSVGLLRMSDRPFAEAST